MCPGASCLCGLAASQFPGLLRQQVLEAEGFPPFRAVKGAVLGLHRVLRNKRMARRLCLSVFLPPMLFCLQKDQPHEASQGADRIVCWASSEVGLKDAFETRPRFLPSSTFQLLGKTPKGKLKVFSAQFCWHFGFALQRTLSHKKDPDRVAFRAVCFGNDTCFSNGGVDCHRLRKAVRSSSSVTCLEPFAQHCSQAASGQRLGTSQIQERMGATSRPTTLQHPPNARDPSCYMECP